MCVVGPSLFVVSASLGVWCCVAPESVTRFYSKHLSKRINKYIGKKKKAAKPKLETVRVFGLLWIFLVVMITVIRLLG